MGKEKQAIASSSSSSESQTKRRKIRRTIRKRRRRNEKLVTAPSSLPDDVVEEIFLRLPVKALTRLKSLSKQWRLAIESLSFAERHLKVAERSYVDHPKVMVISERYPLQGFHHWIYLSESCDGLICIYSMKTQSIYVVNPATRWLRQLPPSRYQVFISKVNNALEDGSNERSETYLAFVKAASTGYKLVWLYNSNDDSNETITKCEVFDFKSNAWRYLTCTPRYRIFRKQTPVSANGSLYWLTEPYNSEIKVVAFDIHTETFRLFPKLVSSIATSDPQYIDMCTLDNYGLCMSKRQGDTKIQEIWRLKLPLQDSWEKVYSIDMLSCSSRTKFGDDFDWAYKDLVEPFTPLAICKNNKILLSHRFTRTLVKYDPQTKSLSCFSKHCLCIRRHVPYFQSLISHI